ncbi:FtsB family cell division protein [Pseudobacteroides cellulosolvens]|uniref:Septum formation initiator n=1 Tax=Pseudobacteroides cellulosolvens ATCC 35603 = DSM 2933 TaxID=398512 RepID=A0A0L6JPK9_9FIRM|nr:septum formation initiator family protein [Pseudobacteroides cellulosolvens]KNY27312.1 Septum formation initiator [Pseudobacteroides cellulosolvens ATCC 35603 = DSM 2933]
MKKKKKSKFWFIVIALILLYSGYISYSLKGLLDSKKEQHNDLQNKISLQKKQKAELEKQMKNINSDEYIEKVAREKLGMVKKNERVYVDVNR